MSTSVEKEFWTSVRGDKLQLSEEEQALYKRAILAAKEAYASPEQSGYHVLTCAMAEDGRCVTGGNKEYALSDAFVHGETAVVSAFRDQYRDTPIKAIVFYSKGPIEKGKGACPCGNCRDVMRRYCDPNMLIIEGNEDSALVSRLNDFFFEDYRQANPENLLMLRGLGDAMRAYRESKTVYLPEKLKHEVYGVSLVASSGVWRGSLYTNAAYDAVTPALSAIQTWKNTIPETDIGKHLSIEQVVCVSKGKIPHVLYRDRQALLELDEVLRLYSKRTTPLPVYLFQLDDDGKIVQTRETNVVELLPLPFSPGNFGMYEVINKELQLYLQHV